MTILNEPHLFISAFAVLWKQLEKEHAPEKEVFSKLQTLLKKWYAEYGIIRVNSRPVPATPGPSPSKSSGQARSLAGQSQQKPTPAPIQRRLPANATAGPSDLRSQKGGGIASDEALARHLHDAWNNEVAGGATFKMLNKDDSTAENESGEDSPMEEDDEDGQDESQPSIETSVAKPKSWKGKGKAKFDDEDYNEGAEESEKKGKGKRRRPKSKPKATPGDKTDAEGNATSNARRPPKSTGIPFPDPCKKCIASKESCEMDVQSGENGACFRCRQKKIKCSRRPPRTNQKRTRQGTSKVVVSDSSSDEDDAEPSKPSVLDVFGGNPRTPSGDRPARRAAEEANVKSKILIAAEKLIHKDGRKKVRPTYKRRRADDELTERVEEVVKGECRISIIYDLLILAVQQDICNEWRMLTRNPPISASSSPSSAAP